MAAPNKGLRYDAGKNRLDLLPAEWVWGLGAVMTQGAKKYAARNWEAGMPWSKCVGPMLRHAFKWLAGEEYDKETGCHHLLMVAWNALALFTYTLRACGEDDLNRNLADPAGARPVEAMAAVIQVEPEAPPVSTKARGPSLGSPGGLGAG